MAPEPLVKSGIVIERLNSLVARAGFYQVGTNRVVFLSLLSSGSLGLITYLVFGIYAFGLAVTVLTLLAIIEFLRIRAASRYRRMLDAWPAVFELTQSGYAASIPLIEQVEEIEKSGPKQLQENFSALRWRIEVEDEEQALDWFRLTIANRYGDFYALLNLLSLHFGLSGQVGSWSDLANQSRMSLQRENEISSRHNWSMAVAKFGLLAPWLIVLLLIQRPEGLISYQSATGNQVMLLALIISVFAYVATDRIGRVKQRGRVFDAAK